MDTIEGLCLALDAGPLVESPDWTRIDNRFGDIRPNRIQISRGRKSERDKVSIGTLTANGNDKAGALDPTNGGGPFEGDLNPIKQAGYALYNPIADTWATIFRGHLADIDPYTIDVSAKYATFQLNLVDALDILNDSILIADQAGNTVASESTGDVFYTGQQVDDRIRALIADAATAAFGMIWPAGLLSIFSGNVPVQGTIYSGGSSTLTAINDAQDAEFPMFANFFASKDGVLSFRGRFARSNPSLYGIPTWSCGDIPSWQADNTVAVIKKLTLARGKTNLINNLIVSPKGIKDADIAGQNQMDSTSISQYGVRSLPPIENLITAGGDEMVPRTANEETALYAQDIVGAFKTPRTRVSQLVFGTPPFDDARGGPVWALAQGVDLGHVISLTTHHNPHGGGFTDEILIVEGITYDISFMNGEMTNFTLTLDLSPQGLAPVS